MDTSHRTGFRHTGVAYFAQWASPEGVRAIVEDRADPCDDPSWTASGFPTPDEYRFWARRVCGLACLQSVLAHWDIEAPARAEMVRLALEWGAYRRPAPDRVEGLTYAPFAAWLARDFGLDAQVLGRLPLADLPSHISEGSFVIASVSSEIRYPDRPASRQGGHLVLVHGWDDHGLYFHNPSGVPPHQRDAYVTNDVFDRFYASRGIAIRRRGDS